MHITTEERAAAEVLFKRDCGNYDSKHINNLADREVPEDLLERIETGCPIEALDEIAKDFPIASTARRLRFTASFPRSTRSAWGPTGAAGMRTGM